MNGLQRLLLRLRTGWAMRGSAPDTMTGLGTPHTQRQQLTADEKFKEAHGFSAATTPLPWSEDISKHNTAISAEYNAEVDRRKAAYAAGEYSPRFFCDVWNPEMHDYLPAVNWDLEMTIDPGRRQDVTKEPGVPMQPILTTTEYADARLAGNLAREVTALEGGANLDPKTPRQFIGSRTSIVAACGGNEALADQIEANARTMFGVEDLDAPIETVYPAEEYADALRYDQAMKKDRG